MTIADTVEALTPEWLTEALASSASPPTGPVTSVQAEPVGTGQMCDSVRLTLGYDRPGAGPASLVAKMTAQDPSSRGAALALRLYETEVRFYQQLAPHLAVRTPAVYYADIDVPEARFVLLLEDLAPARQGDQLTGCDLGEATLAVDELVKLHAPRWDDPTLADLEWLRRDPDGTRAYYRELLPSLWAGFRERYAGILGPDVHTAGDALFDHLDRFLDVEARTTTIVHNDYRLDNLLFGVSAGGVPIAVVDWQTCGIGPALNDVAYFVGAGLLPDSRRAHESALVRRYHDGLLRAGVRDYDWDTCWTDYRRGTWSGFVMAVSAAMLVQQTERGDEMFMAMAHRHARHVLDLEATDLLGVG